MPARAAFLRLAHDLVWTRLPRDFRRRALFQATAHIAPLPDPTARAVVPPFYVAGVLRAATGLGQSARMCLTALSQAGIPVKGIDLSEVLMQELGLPPDEHWLPKPRPGPGTLLLHVNGPLTGLALMGLGREGLRGKRNIGYWHWELTELPRDWRTGIRLVHEIWVSSRFVAAAVGKLTDKPIHVVPHPVLTDPALARVGSNTDRTTDGIFRVLTMFDMAGFARKNPLAAIRAFRQAFGDRLDRELVVKIQNSALYPQGGAALREAISGARNIRIVDADLARTDVIELIRAADAVLSLHRSEGFGLMMAEAMTLGRVAIATGWSGNLEFMTADNSALVRYKLIAARDEQHTYDFPHLQWADADVDDAVAWLVRLAESPDLRARLAHAGQATAMQQFSVDAYARRVNEIAHATLAVNAKTR